jgi:hypothetical protein
MGVIEVFVENDYQAIMMIEKVRQYGFEAKQPNLGLDAYRSGNDVMLLIPDSKVFIFVAGPGHDYSVVNDYGTIHNWLEEIDENTDKLTDVSEEELRDRLSAMIDELEYLLDLAKEGFDS